MDDYLSRVRKTRPDAPDKAVELVQESNLYAFEETQFVDRTVRDPATPKLRWP